MNLQYIRYALEIARTGSISKAAENLSVAQPNLSRAVKELETGLGISIFERTRSGMSVTPEGEKLLSAGERILREVGELETMFTGDAVPRQTLSITLPRSEYLACGLARFVRELDDGGRYDVIARDAGADEAIAAVERGESRLGILRYPTHFESYYTELLNRHALAAEVITTFSPVVVACVGSPLARVDAVRPADLADLCEITYPDAPLKDAAGGDALSDRRLMITDARVRMELLSSDSTTYAHAAPIPPSMAARYGLMTRPLAEADVSFADVLIYPKHYRLSPLDRRLLTVLGEAAK